MTGPLLGSNAVDMGDVKPLESSYGKSIEQCINAALDAYFSDLDGHGTHDLYQMVMATVEKPMLEAVLHHTRGNQTRAAEVLGINRGTLRKKLKQYGLDD